MRQKHHWRHSSACAIFSSLKGSDRAASIPRQPSSCEFGFAPSFWPSHHGVFPDSMLYSYRPIAHVSELNGVSKVLLWKAKCGEVDRPREELTAVAEVSVEFHRQRVGVFGAIIREDDSAFKQPAVLAAILKLVRGWESIVVMFVNRGGNRCEGRGPENSRQDVPKETPARCTTPPAVVKAILCTPYSLGAQDRSPFASFHDHVPFVSASQFCPIMVVEWSVPFRPAVRNRH